jgi:predicted DNA-binding transcriptional regulator YafY
MGIVFIPTDISNLGGQMPQPRAARWGQGRRLEFIDFRLCWEGRVNRSDLMDFFGVSVPQASLDLAKYLELAPQNIVYDRTEKAYVATEQFAPVIASKHAESFLNQALAVQMGFLEPNSSFIAPTTPVDAVRDPSRTVDATTLRTTLSAIRQKSTLGIEYQSMSRPIPSVRLISPHAIAYDGFRWHIRGYCHEDEAFRDFLFARILDCRLVSGTYVGSSSDVEWNSEIEVIIAPHPELTEAQRRAIELDFGMSEGQLVLKTRTALLFYLLRHLGLLPRASNAAVSQQVILANRDSLIPFFKAHGLPR